MLQSLEVICRTISPYRCDVPSITALPRIEDKPGQVKGHGHALSQWVPGKEWRQDRWPQQWQRWISWRWKNTIARRGIGGGQGWVGRGKETGGRENCEKMRRRSWRNEEEEEEGKQKKNVGWSRRGWRGGIRKIRKIKLTRRNEKEQELGWGGGGGGRRRRVLEEEEEDC